MEKFTIEFWVIFQMLIDLALVFMVLYLLRNMKSGMHKNTSNEVAVHVIGLVEPLLKEAKSVASGFDTQLKEKKRLINKLNDEIDSRIISLNLLLNREKVSWSSGSRTFFADDTNIYDQQEAIFDLYKKGNTAETIARKTAIPKGEVDLVIGLKKKFQSS